MKLCPNLKGCDRGTGDTEKSAYIAVHTKTLRGYKITNHTVTGSVAQ